MLEITMDYRQYLSYWTDIIGILAEEQVKLANSGPHCLRVSERTNCTWSVLLLLPQ